MNEALKIFNSIIDSIAVIDKNGNIVFTNFAWKEFSRANNGDLAKTDCGVNYFEVCENVIGVEYEGAMQAKNGIEDVINGVFPFFEIEYPCHSSHARRWFLMRVTPVYSLEQYFMIKHMDITERKLSEERVVDLNKMLLNLNERLKNNIFKMAHDIQGPLNSVEGLILLAKKESNEKEKELFSMLIEQSILKLKAQIQSTLKSAHLELNIEPIVFQKVYDEIIESVKFMEAFEKVQMQVDIKQFNVFYSGKSEIVSILSNLISNAIKYADHEKQKPFVRISVFVSDTEATITVSDNGIGIQNELLDDIFNLNYQIKSQGNAGAGIGLYLVKKDIDLISGKLEVKSVIAGGTVFSIRLPDLKP